MNTNRIEELLEKLIEKQNDTINRLDSLESKLAELLTDTNHNLSTISLQFSEINQTLPNLESNLTEISSSITSIERALNWWGDETGFAKQLNGQLSGMELAILNLSNREF